MTGLLPHSKCGSYREPDRETIRINMPLIESPQISCGAHVLGGVAAVKNTESVQARPTTNPRKLCVFHCRFATKSRIETNFNGVYLSNCWAYSAEILKSSPSFYQLSNPKKRERSEKVNAASCTTLKMILFGAAHTYMAYIW